MRPAKEIVALFGALVLFSVCFAASSAQASFGVNLFDVTYSNADGSTDAQAGSHPYAMTTSLRFNAAPNGKGGEEADEAVKDILVSQVPGFVGDLTAVPACSSAGFLVEGENLHGEPVPDCPDSTVIGVVEVKLSGEIGSHPIYAAVYNLEAPPGVTAKIGFWANFLPVPIELGVSESYPHSVIGGPTNVSQLLEVIDTKLTLWGVPADSAHDTVRGRCLRAGDGGSYGSCPAGVSQRPFLTLPRACEGPLSTSYSIDSWPHPGLKLANGEPDLSDPNWLGGSVETHDDGEPSGPQGFTGCGRLGFGPTITTQPTTKAASSPTGLDFSLDVKDEGLTNPTGLADSDIKKAVVALPEGMTANPSLAVGLSVCTQQDLARETARSSPGEGCPNESKIGTVEVQTPLLSEPLKGALYIAKPYQNPFGSLLAIYFVIKDPTLGINIVQTAKVIPDPTTGRIVTVVENIPQLPFSHFRLHFREGARSPLVSPPGCGTYNATAELTPWAGGAPVTTTSAFQIVTGPDETRCPTGGVPPFAPEAVSGTQNNNAGSYSPFYLRIGRKDGEQELTRFTTNLPSGLTGNLSGIPFCPDSAIETARTKTGTQETNEPSCPTASQIGHTLVGAGVGGVLAYAPGKVYLAGPYHGSALSVVSITSATVGPFDLGTVVIRFALRINPITAQVEIDSNGSDPIPHIIQGIVVHVRDIHVYVDREKFILNPTSCNPKSIGNMITGAGADITTPVDDVSVTTSNRFQAADCANLAFKPSFKVSTSGKTSRNNGASLNVKLTYPKAPLGTQTNIKSVKVDLPKQLPSRLSTLQQACTDAQFETNPAGCPAASRVGQATAITPILPVPITGPAYFVSHGGAKFPELILVLQGYGITIDLHGETFISKTGITSSTFRTVPDQPVTSFELTLPEGPNSALAANGNLCGVTKTVLVKRKVTVRVKGHRKTVTRQVRTTLPASLTMPTVFTAQNGAVVKQNTPIHVSGCTRHKAKTARSHVNRHKK